MQLITTDAMQFVSLEHRRTVKYVLSGGHEMHNEIGDIWMMSCSAQELSQVTQYNHSMYKTTSKINN